MKKEEFLIEEYKILWSYYKETINNRKNMLDWYFKIIAIPATLFTLISSLDNVEIENGLLGIILLIISLSGVGIFVGYVLESKNSKRYLEEIQRIKCHLKGNKYSTILKLNVSIGPLVNEFRVAPVVLINSFLFGSSVYFMSSLEFCLIILISTAIAISHYLFYILK